MCHECSNRGCDDRCTDCRPRYGKSELDERRLNRVQRSPMVRCEACGFEGPRFDSVAPATAKLMLAVVLLGACSLGIGGLIVAISAVAGGPAICTACGRADELEPSRATNLAFPANWNALVAVRRQMIRNNLLKLALTVLGMGGLVFLILTIMRD